MLDTRRTRFKKAILALVLVAVLVLTACTGPRGWPGASVEDNVLYAGTMDGRVLAVNPDSGANIWEWTPGGKKQASSFLGCSCAGSQLTGGKFYSPPVIANGVIYISTYTGLVYAIDANSGVELWSYKIGSAIAGGVAVTEDTLYVGATDGNLYAIDITTEPPQERFTPFKAGDKIWTTPVFQDGIVYFGSLDHNLYAIDAATGEKEWVFPTGGSITAEPLIVGGTIYIGSHDNKLYAVNAETGNATWVFDSAGNWFWSKAVYYDGIVYAGSLDHYIYAIYAGNRTLAWPKFDASGPLISSPVIAGGMLVVASEEGKVYGLDPKTGEQRWSQDIETKVLAPLSSDGSKVYIDTHDNKVYALDGKTGKQVWGPVSL